MSSIDPEADQLSARFDFDAVSLIGLLDGDDRLTRAMRITVSRLDGAHEFRYPVGDQLSAQTATFGVTIDVVVFLWTLLVTWIATLLLAWAWGLRSTAAILGGTRPQ